MDRLGICMICSRGLIGVRRRVKKITIIILAIIGRIIKI